jgi:hypothetical protein
MKESCEQSYGESYSMHKVFCGLDWASQIPAHASLGLCLYLKMRSLGKGKSVNNVERASNAIIRCNVKVANERDDVPQGFVAASSRTSSSLSSDGKRTKYDNPAVDIPPTVKRTESFVEALLLDDILIPRKRSKMDYYSNTFEPDGMYYTLNHGKSAAYLQGVQSFINSPGAILDACICTLFLYRKVRVFLVEMILVEMILVEMILVEMIVL